MRLAGGTLDQKVAIRLAEYLCVTLGLKSATVLPAVFLHGNSVTKLRGGYLHYHQAPMRGVAMPDDLFHGEFNDVVDRVAEYLRPQVDRDLAEALAETLE